MKIWTDALTAAGIPQDQLNVLLAKYKIAMQDANDQRDKSLVKIDAEANGLYGLVDRY